MNGRLSPRPMRCLALSLLLALIVPAAAKPAKMLDVSDCVTTTVILSKLATMLQGSPELVTFLSSRGPFTVFAPTNSAFAKLPPGTLEALLRPENKERLEHILLYHVINGKRYSAKDLLTVTSLKSCEGSPLPVKKNKAGAQFILKAKLVHGDIRCGNGVIHQIDTVLFPPEASMPPLAPPLVIVPDTNAPPVNPAAPIPPATSPATTNAPPGTL